MSHIVHLGDCIAGMRDLQDASIDHVISDPPYSKDLYARTRTNKGSGVRKNGRPYARTELREYTSALQLASDAIGSIDDILDPVAAEMMRLARRWIIVFSDIEIAPRWRAAFGDAYVRTGIWVKTDAMPQVTGDRPAQGFEACTIAHVAKRKRWNGGGLPAVWTEGTSKGAERPDHPCPKPVALMETLVRLFSDPGELVLDPFAGSGTTGVACKRLGRRFVGFELDPKFYAAAQARIDATREQLELVRTKKPRPRQEALL